MEPGRSVTVDALFFVNFATVLNKLTVLVDMNYHCQPLIILVDTNIFFHCLC